MVCGERSQLLVPKSHGQTSEPLHSGAGTQCTEPDFQTTAKCAEASTAPDPRSVICLLVCLRQLRWDSKTNPQETGVLKEDGRQPSTLRGKLKWTELSWKYKLNDNVIMLFFLKKKIRKTTHRTGNYRKAAFWTYLNFWVDMTLNQGRGRIFQDRGEDLLNVQGWGTCKIIL